MKYVVRVWCGDCTEPGYGCNDGSPWYVCGDDDKPTVFDTREEAESAGWKHVADCPPWGFDVEESP